MSAEEVRRMFAEVAPRYDLLNHALSLGLDYQWRRAAAGEVAALCGAATAPSGEAAELSDAGAELSGDAAALQVADICCGTGDLAATVARRIGPRSRVIGLDFCEPMIVLAKRKYGGPGVGNSSAGAVGRPALEFLVADATQLPLGDGSCDAATCAFGLRNVPDLDRALAEMVRIVRPGGRIVVLELFQPAGRLWPQVFGFYFRRILPIVGRVVSGHRSAYSYLPASVAGFVSPGELQSRLLQAGAARVRVRRLAGRVAALVVAEMPPPAGR